VLEHETAARVRKSDIRTDAVWLHKRFDQRASAGAPVTQSNTRPEIRVRGMVGPVEEESRHTGIAHVPTDVSESAHHDHRVGVFARHP